MAKTKKQRERERFAALCDDIAGRRSEGGKRLREANRRVEKRNRSRN